VLLLEKKIYEETKKIALGKKKLSPIAQDMRNWFQERFNAWMINYDYVRIDAPKHEEYPFHRYRLRIIFNSRKDFEPLIQHKEPAFLAMPDPDIAQQIMNEFGIQTQKHDNVRIEYPSRIFVVFTDFSDEVKTEANYKAIKIAEDLIEKKYPGVWHVEAEFDHVIVFYFNDNDIDVNLKNGISEKIKSDYYDILKRFDKLGYWTYGEFHVIFDSKENLDKNYEGSLFYYSRR
jgi:hypothetical protein